MQTLTYLFNTGTIFFI